jgi:quercetin dioxygenase-like cupin family protein
MESRRTFLEIAAASLLPIGIHAQTPAPSGPRELARHALTGRLEGFDAVLLELTPGAGPGREHRHTGPVLGYVVDGKVSFGINHETPQLISAGGTFFEPTGALHSAWGAADSNTQARVVVFMVVPKGSSGNAPA